MPTLLEVIQVDPARDRSPALRGPKPDSFKVDRSGGSRRAGLIEGASLIARGEALGHGFWIDSDALDSVVSLGNASDRGVKVRFAHPSMSGDGLGSYLGRAKKLRREGDKVFGDIHFSPSSRSTPDGDLGGYVLDLADDDPEAFGMSIVFDHDFGAEKKFEGKNSDAEGEFTSPDEANERNFPHVRFSALHGADFVDEPAANPDGLFHKGPTAEILSQAEATLEYALGLTDEAPDSEASGGLSAERLRGFLTRFLDGRGLSLTIRESENEMSTSTETDEGVATDENATDEVENTETNDESTGEESGESTENSEAADEGEEPGDGEELSGDIPRSEFKRYVDRFGAEKAAEYLAEGVSYEDAIEKELDEAKTKLANRETDRGEESPVDEFSEGGGDPKSEKRKIAERKAGFNLPIRINGQAVKAADRN